MNTLQKDIAMQTALHLFLDCETIPSQDPKVIDAITAKHALEEPDLWAITADARLTDPAKIEADLEKKRAKCLADHEVALEKANAADAEYRKLCLEGATAHIGCISWAFNDDAVENISNSASAMEHFKQTKVLWAANSDPREGGDTISFVPSFGYVCQRERLMLQSFFNVLENTLRDMAIDRVMADWDRDYGRRRAQFDVTEIAMQKAEALKAKLHHYFKTPVIVAHSADFDIRMIWQRAVILGVPVPSWWPVNFSKYRDDAVQDTMIMWAGHQGRISLDKLCTALGIPGKGDGLDGSKVWDAIQSGKLAEVIEYCDADVERVRSVFQRLRPSTQEVTTTEFWSNRSGRAELVETVPGVTAEELPEWPNGDEYTGRYLGGAAVDD